jgi:hypothetical protein
MMPTSREGAVPTAPGAAVPGVVTPKMFKLRQYDFVVQFCWQPQPRGKRIEMAQKKNAPAGEGAPSTAAAGTEAPAAGPSS